VLLLTAIASENKTIRFSYPLASQIHVHFISTCHLLARTPVNNLPTLVLYLLPTNLK